MRASSSRRKKKAAVDATEASSSWKIADDQPLFVNSLTSALVNNADPGVSCVARQNAWRRSRLRQRESRQCGSAVLTKRYLGTTDNFLLCLRLVKVTRLPEGYPDGFTLPFGPRTDDT